MLDCSYAARCSGCDWILKPIEEQVELKTAHFQEIWQDTVGAPLPELRFISIAEGGLRDRADLIIDGKTGFYHLGLFDRDRAEIVDFERCPQMSPALEAWLADFRKIEIPVSRGSVRLRVSPTGERGVWLDFANVDVKRLLDERTAFDQLRAIAIVEIGQRRKRLVERDGLLKLADPILAPWFETYLDDPITDNDLPLPLYCSIGSFTQPGFTANRVLVREARDAIALSGAKKAAEFGSGIGNFTLPLASVCEEVHAYEVDALAVEGLNRSLEDWRRSSTLADRVKMHTGNYQITRKERLDFRGFDLIFVDPPRSGLLNFLEPLAGLASHERARDFVYVSCYTESFAKDCARLYELGYNLESVALIDQFPQSRHYEIVARLKH